jgi:hypothetical protein
MNKKVLWVFAFFLVVVGFTSLSFIQNSAAANPLVDYLNFVMGNGAELDNNPMPGIYFNDPMPGKTIYMNNPMPGIRAAMMNDPMPGIYYNNPMPGKTIFMNNPMPGSPAR